MILPLFPQFRSLGVQKIKVAGLSALLVPNLPTVLQQLKPIEYLAFRSPSCIINHTLFSNNYSQTASI
ncbi:hypothetical protein C7B67_02120 [filamentous cyanobacterium Phorm 6]|nr:hypothetical protein C7B67_02120 [filamentous cyanobacterium Phorm 6]